MKQRFWGAIVTALVFILFAGYVLWSLIPGRGGENKAARNISVVLYGNEADDRWRSLEQGIAQACAELGMERPVLTMARIDDPQRQRSLLEREVENGAQGLLVAPGDSLELREYLEGLSAGVPLVLVENGAGDALPLVGADNARMGREIADLVADVDGNIAVLVEGHNRSNVVERYDAFIGRMKDLGKQVLLLENTGRQGRDLKAFIASSLADNRLMVDVLVVLDNDSLEVAVEAVPASMVEARLFGIGNSNRVLHALDTGILEELVFQNEYAMGYIATMALASDMGLVKSSPQADIQHAAVRRETMYDTDMERLLFPINQ